MSLVTLSYIPLQLQLCTIMYPINGSFAFYYYQEVVRNLYSTT